MSTAHHARATSTDGQSTQRITRGDLERKFRAVQDDLQGRLDDKRQGIVAVASVVGVVAVVLVYLLGRRAGRRAMTFVEIRRG